MILIIISSYLIESGHTMWTDLGGGGQLAKPPSEKISHCSALYLAK